MTKSNPQFYLPPPGASPKQCGWTLGQRAAFEAWLKQVDAYLQEEFDVSLETINTIPKAEPGFTEIRPFVHLGHLIVAFGDGLSYKDAARELMMP